MAVIPAKVAGVKELVLCTPPAKDGKLNPYLLSGASFLGVDEIYRIGGAQAISAMALGTETIPKVDKIVGPGSLYVTSAKKLLYGEVDIDLLAGPSEIVIFADKNANPSFISSDLSAQAEHRDGFSLLITTSPSLLSKLYKSAPGYAILLKKREQAVDLINEIAPEHIQIMSERPEEFAKNIKNSGAIFIGDYSPATIGDYWAGPSHILPTLGTATSFSGVSPFTFLRSYSIISWRRERFLKEADDILAIANLEGLFKHAESIKIRKAKL